MISAINFAGGTLATAYNFAEIGTPIGGVVYRDANRDSTKQVSEIGLSGVSLELRDAGNALIASTTTASDGTYSFPPQPAGSYTVVESQPSGYQRDRPAHRLLSLFAYNYKALFGESPSCTLRTVSRRTPHPAAVRDPWLQYAGCDSASLTDSTVTSRCG